MFRGTGGVVEYHGEFVIDADRPFDFAQAPETGGGAMRKVVIFNLLPVEQVKSAATPKNTGRVVSLEVRSTDRTLVQPSIDPIEAVRRESELVHDFAAWLEDRGVKAVSLACTIAGADPGERCAAIYMLQNAGILSKQRGS